MKIGINLSPLQSPHRMRGIGYTLINFVNNISAKDRSDNEFVFFVSPEAESSFGNPLELLSLEGMSYETRQLKPRKRSSKVLPGRLNMLVSAYNRLIEIRDLHFGDSRIDNIKGVDTYLQTDQSMPLPRKFGLKKYLMLYDIIPYVLEWDYLWSYKTARVIHGFSRKAALRCHVRRWLYGYMLKINVRRANKLLAISAQTKNDFVNLLGIPAKKIEVVPLGVNIPTKTSDDSGIKLHQYKKTSWGYMKRPLDLNPDISFLLFIGGADKRRKLEDLVAAFNNLRAQGHELKLVLAGDSMQGPGNIATERIQSALKSSSYLDDIIFLGFVDDEERDWLYKHALAFIFPSKYEGFGLPVLEAMIHSCPVISYPNAATKEVAGQAPIYVDNPVELFNAIIDLLDMTDKEIKQRITLGVEQAEKYSWQKTSSKIVDALGS